VAIGQGHQPRSHPPPSPTAPRRLHRRRGAGQQAPLPRCRHTASVDAGYGPSSISRSNTQTDPATAHRYESPDYAVDHRPVIRPPAASLRSSLAQSTSKTWFRVTLCDQTTPALGRGWVNDSRSLTSPHTQWLGLCLSTAEQPGGTFHASGEPVGPIMEQQPILPFVGTICGHCAGRSIDQRTEPRRRV
jgi:hypothetical protein